jgi:hypothetical protein
MQAYGIMWGRNSKYMQDYGGSMRNLQNNISNAHVGL